MRQLYNKVGEIKPDNLFNDINVSVSEKSVKIKKSATPLKRGTVLGVITATGFAIPVDSSKADGSQLADCILADDVDASAADTVAVAYTKGQFNRKALIFTGTETVENYEAQLRDVGIYLKDNI